MALTLTLLPTPIGFPSPTYPWPKPVKPYPSPPLQPVNSYDMPQSMEATLAPRVLSTMHMLLLVS